MYWSTANLETLNTTSLGSISWKLIFVCFAQWRTLLNLLFFCSEPCIYLKAWPFGCVEDPAGNMYTWSHQCIVQYTSINICIHIYTQIYTPWLRRTIADLQFTFSYSHYLAVMKATFITAWSASLCSRCLSWTALPRPRILWLEPVLGFLVSAQTEGFVSTSSLNEESCEGEDNSSWDFKELNTEQNSLMDLKVWKSSPEKTDYCPRRFFFFF